MPRTKIAFLYSEIAGYFLASAKKLAEQAEVMIVRWPVNDEAPFQFTTDNHLEILVKSDFSREELARKVAGFKPDIVVCSGWMDKDYLNIVKKQPKSVKCVLSLDNHWNGSLKQQMARLLSPFFLKRHFTHAWVPGKPQVKYAQRLGFRLSHILTGFYCADTALFHTKYKESFPQKKEHFPKRFLYVGRYVKHKGIFELWKAFIAMQEANPSDWELWCLGTGEEWENRIEHKKIKHIGFVQPHEMEKYINETGVYVLPSAFEPWGVTVHEFALAGFPLLLSNAVGAKHAFLAEGINGYSFVPDDEKALQNALEKIIRLKEKELVEAGEASHRLGMEWTTTGWAEMIQSIK